ncbi:cysteine--tRNA ligase [Pseudanabaena sp. FACHB-1998]|uniref:cysteine--tRNA ligase n=1 Tax=Pseudanabaena sp. FACHB-1998 TaxID=2692858 RepID=UPI0016802694|nr:cysteine--tRNA ligase [Pseudanabaena sp. FACHB-1998]MBD2177056.1 cysteine--tRNA ligase [Pseudanabaena sp. FACHB-1998]
MTLRIYNTLTRRKEEFIPLEAGVVKMYVCGVTVYDYCHLGHARAYVVWDMVRRYLATKYQIKFVQNITDIDDKILKRAQERGTTMQAIANQYIATYDEDMARLNILKADDYPRATESIPEIMELIQKLIDCDYAYAAGGDVYYAVQKFPSYGKLSGRKLEDMQAGASGRVDDQEEQKRYPFDFALWKAAKPNEPFWESPWGKGRPGWHIECSAMVRSHLGETIDIHAGGTDLQFPHHENEIAQSEAGYGKNLAKYWMHNGFVNIDGEKMSKSLNNFKTIRDLFEYFDPMAIRLFILQAQYRQPIDFTEEAINAATKGWETIREAMLFAADFSEQLGWSNVEIPARDLIAESVACFEEAMDDDFNTSVAIAHVFELAKKLRAERNSLSHSGKTAAGSEVLWQDWQALSYMTNILGFIADISDREAVAESISEAQIEVLIQQRIAAKKAKNYPEGDRIREELKALGITLVDQKDGTTRWIRS